MPRTARPRHCSVDFATFGVKRLAPHHAELAAVRYAIRDAEVVEIAQRAADLRSGKLIIDSGQRREQEEPPPRLIGKRCAEKLHHIHLRVCHCFIHTMLIFSQIYIKYPRYTSRFLIPKRQARPRHVEQTRSLLLYFVSEADTASRRRPSASQILATVSMVTFIRPFSIRQRWPASRPQRSARSRTESPAALRA